MGDDTSEYEHVVMMSSGAGSAVAAKRVAERFGTDRLTLLFADVNMEHPDNYRFLAAASLFSLLEADEGDACNCMGDPTDVPVAIGGAA